MKPIRDMIEKKPWTGWALFVGTMVVVFLLGLLAASIMERRSEALFAYKPTNPIRDFEPRPEVWGKNYPREWTAYRKNLETNFKSKYNGNGEVDMLKEDPRLVILWAGYAFSKEYNQPRGHMYAITDIRKILRTGAPKNENDGPQPGTCWTCKGPDVPRMMNEVGIGDFYKAKWAKWGAEIVNPISCGDCHDPKSMDLKITRPALIEAFQRQGQDVTAATHQDKRSLVCAQCHVEYYFKSKEDPYLIFPWDKGSSADDIEKYYDEIPFKDWEHALSKAPMLKAQHPDYELWKQGIHSKRGVSCADCHMPYITEGGVKYTDHHIQSPLNNINRSCQTCHRQSEQELMNNVYSIQDKVFELRIKAEDVLVKAHLEAKAAWDAGATEKEMEPILKHIRHAQWRWDFTAAGHGSSFHAGLESSRILGTSIEKSSEARRLLAIVLQKHGIIDVPIPDLSSKEKAQKFIGINLDSLNAEKQDFLKTIVPEWDKKAQERQSKWDKEYEEMQIKK